MWDSTAQHRSRSQHSLHSDTQYVFQVRCRLSAADSPWSAWSSPFLYTTPEAGKLSLSTALSKQPSAPWNALWEPGCGMGAGTSLETLLAGIRHDAVVQDCRHITIPTLHLRDEHYHKLTAHLMPSKHSLPCGMPCRSW